MTLRTDKALDQALTALSDLEGVSKQEVIRRAIEERLERMVHEAEVDAASAQLREQWSDVLRRLGE